MASGSDIRGGRKPAGVAIGLLLPEWETLAGFSCWFASGRRTGCKLALWPSCCWARWWMAVQIWSVVALSDLVLVPGPIVL